MKVRGKAGVEELKGNREQIVITEIPYNVNRATLVERIAALVNEKVLTDITAIRDESDENTRVVIELKRDAQSEGRHQQSLQAHRAGKLLRGQHAGDRSRPAEAASAQGREHRLTSIIAAKSSCAGRVSNCAKPRSAPKRSKVISSRWPISMNSSASSADQPIATKRASNCSRSNSPETPGRTNRHSHSQRSASDRRPLCLQRASGQSDSRSAPLSTDRAGARQDHQRIQGTDRDDQGFARHSGERSARLHHHQERAARDSRQVRLARA